MIIIEDFNLVLHNEVIESSEYVHFYFFDPLPLGSITTLFTKVGSEFGGERLLTLIDERIIRCKYIGITRIHGINVCLRIIPINSIVEFKLK